MDGTGIGPKSQSICDDENISQKCEIPFQSGDAAAPILFWGVQIDRSEPPFPFPLVCRVASVFSLSLVPSIVRRALPSLYLLEGRFVPAESRVSCLIDMGCAPVLQVTRACSGVAIARSIDRRLFGVAV
jgi:hypothetical protein